MTDKTTISFRIRDKGGPSGGKTVSGEVPKFNLEDFLKTPNVEEFIKKSYYASVKKIIREIDEKKNGSVTADLSTTEAIVARSLSFTKEEIRDWLKARDWSRATNVKDIDKVKRVIERALPELASRRHQFTPEEAMKLADKVIAAIADTPDPVADFLFTTLTTVRASDSDFNLLL